MSEHPSELQVQIRSMQAVVRYLLLSQLVLGVLWLIGSIVLNFAIDNPPIVIGLVLAAINIPVLARLSSFELQRTIIDYQRQSSVTDEKQQQKLKSEFEQLKGLRRNWVGATGLAFLASAVLSTAAVLTLESLLVISQIAIVLLWLAAGVVLLFMARDTRAIIQGWAKASG